MQRRLPFPFPGLPGAPQAGERLQNSLGSVCAGAVRRADRDQMPMSSRAPTRFRVVLCRPPEYEAKLLSQDERYDLALLRNDTSGEKFPFLEMRDSDSIEVGDIVLANGNPFGLNQTVTSGIISAVSRSAGGINDSSFFIQTDCRDQSGQLGGALVSLDGRLIGINTAIYSQTGGSVGIGFATPSKHRHQECADRRAGRPHRAPLARHQHAARHGPISPAGFGLTRPAGLVVKEVFPDGPGAQLGCGATTSSCAARPADRRRGESALYRLATLQVDSTVAVKVIRGGKEQVVNLKLAAPPEIRRATNPSSRAANLVRGGGGQHVTAVADELAWSNGGPAWP